MVLLSKLQIVAQPLTASGIPGMYVQNSSLTAHTKYFTWCFCSRALEDTNTNSIRIEVHVLDIPGVQTCRYALSMHRVVCPLNLTLRQ